MVTIHHVHPPHWPPAKGYANGMRVGDLLFVAGQIGGEPGANGRHRMVSPRFVPQFDRALQNLVEVVRAAGGSPDRIVEMTVFVKGMRSYRAARRKLGPVWKRHLGAHFPAMTLVEVKDLFEPGSLVEIRAVAALG